MGEMGKERGGIRLAGGLLVGGFLFNGVVTMFHPSGNEDDHESIFTDYAETSAWEAIHLGQLLGVLTALAGIVLLCRLLSARDGWSVLAGFGAAAAVIAGAAFVVLQGLDGVGLKQAADSWVAASGAEKVDRFSDAETVRWLEWGFQSYFRVILGTAFVLLGAAIALARLLPRWLGALAIVTGALSIAVGIDVGYQGLESGLQDAVVPLFQLTAAIFAIAVLIFGLRRGRVAEEVREPLSAS